MADNEVNITSSESSAGGSHLWLRLLIVLGLAAAAAVAGRQWAMSKTDAEFEERLRAADERRD
ncbi:unannotated protein [freshwater metagenome]|uniref:Unannotated protein n=1 Tax=freshwater metagenome TaxID=449393 RepID=A0A6J7I286_9ZZZZ|nr:hypothetical protein [Actinomycetota bacterium]MSY80085.1 hypothetical protein [Actinomycetota bacterium]